MESASDGRQLQVLVEVAESVDVDADAEVFVLARAIGGPPMPLAIQKLARSDLPGLVMLDEKMAMIQGMGLADFDEVQVVARISASGGADISPEDFEIVSSPIDMTKENPVIKLEIETKRKNQ